MDAFERKYDCPAEAIDLDDFENTHLQVLHM